jgi:hypothetical protein
VQASGSDHPDSALDNLRLKKTTILTGNHASKQLPHRNRTQSEHEIFAMHFKGIDHEKLKALKEGEGLGQPSGVSPPKKQVQQYVPKGSIAGSQSQDAR